MNSEVPGAAVKLALRSFRLNSKKKGIFLLETKQLQMETYVSSNKGNEQMSNHQPQTRGKTPISTTDNKETFTTI